MDILISEKDMVTARRGAKRNRWIFCCLAVLCLAVFVAFCLRVRTINARSMTVWMMVVMTLLGWLWDSREDVRDFCLKYCGFEGSNWGDGGPHSGSCRAIIRTLWMSHAPSAL